LNWAYSELFQNYDRGQIENYLNFAFRVSESEGLLMHFAETHDNPRLAARSAAYARMRTALAALCSINGAFAFANGVEWLAAEKIDVHKRTSLNWNNPVNQVDFISRLNHILSGHPAFFSGARLKLINRGKGNSIVLLRHHPPTGKKLLVLVNLDEKAVQPATWSGSEAGLPAARLTDLLTGREIQVTGNDNSLDLAPGEALCLTPEAGDLRLVVPKKHNVNSCDQLRRQRLRAKALEALTAAGRIGDVSGTDPDKMADELADDPREFCGKLMHRKFQEVGPRSLCGRKDGGTSCPALPTEKLSCSAGSNLQPDDNVVSWNWPVDARREVMIPPGYFLLVKAPAPFRARLCEGMNVLSQQDAICLSDGGYFALFMPRPAPANFLACAIDISVYPSPSEGALHARGHILFLPEAGNARIKRVFRRNELLSRDLVFLGTNGRGGMMRAAAKWGELRSKYDALLAGNLDPDHPEDRRVMLTRCRVWLVYQDYSQDVTIDRLELFGVDGSHAHWHFRVPFGYGKMVFMEAEAAMLPGLNAIRLSFKRLPAVPRKHCLADAESVALIIRPDIEDRSFHEETKAFLGPENSFRRAIRPQPDGFVFAPAAGRQLKMNVLAQRGEFHHEPEWQYMVYHPLEAERGLPAHCDLFSPGYFRCELKGGDEVTLSARIITPQEREEAEMPPAQLKPVAKIPEEENISGVLLNALKQFIVRRDNLKTVIAGYPWFLDWGRDTLIFCRGMIAAGLKDEVLSIIRKFASFEQGGTLPNMIIGDNAGNRDSSDAPLWLFVACSDLTRALDSTAWLNEKCADSPGARGSRTMIETLVSIAQSFRKGTGNGIACDQESGLIFSPAHFTWMDTNHPAGTPREGYPVEIQALWFAALKFLTEITGDRQWNDLARLAQESVLKLYWNEKENFFADCLHAARGQPAAKAKADDALRPNQLLALTLGLVTDEKMSAGVLSACSGLLVPGAIRTLADRPVQYPLPVERNGTLLNNPKNPYWGRYEGDEDTRRKPSYHNGTAWTWIFPSFCEAWFKHYGDAGRPTALAILNSSLRIVNRGCLGQVPEILDGDYPHSLRGCDAQAWGVSELYRVWKVLCPD
jgi:predicted glycogen debranching enzyme